MVLGGLGHDIDHPGVNNAFLVATGDPLALLYNDRSVLENAHASCLFLIMRRHPDADITASLSPEQRKRLRSLMVRIILATDMDRHAAVLKTLDEMTPCHEIVAKKGLGEVVDEEHRARLCEIIIKCADLGHLTRPWPHAKWWEDQVMVEFFQQGDKEKALGMEPMALFDRQKCKIAASQVWFYENIGRGLFHSLVRHLPCLKPLLTQMNEVNIPEWKGIAAEEAKVSSVTHASTESK